MSAETTPAVVLRAVIAATGLEVDTDRACAELDGWVADPWAAYLRTPGRRGSSLTEQRMDPGDQIAAAWCRILLREERVGEAPEIVDRRWALLSRDERTAYEPMRRDRENRTRSGQ